MKAYGDWALVTGASSGIGMAMAERLCRDGLNCILVSNEREQLDAVARRLAEEHRTRTISCHCDLSRHDFMDQIRGQIEGIPVDVLVCCASFGILRPFLEVPLATYLENIHLNVVAYFQLTYDLLQGMIRRDRGAVILVSSVNAYAPVGYSAVYTAGKAFELYFGEALWKELADRKSKVDILTLCASSTRTNFQSRADTKIARWAWSPEQVVEVALASLGKRPSVTFSWRGKAYRFLSRLLPSKLRLHFSTWAISSTLRKHAGQ